MEWITVLHLIKKIGNKKIEFGTSYTCWQSICNNILSIFQDAGTLNKLHVTNAHGESEIRFKLGLGEKPAVGK